VEEAKKKRPQMLKRVGTRRYGKKNSSKKLRRSCGKTTFLEGQKKGNHPSDTTQALTGSKHGKEKLKVHNSEHRERFEKVARGGKRQKKKKRQEKPRDPLVKARTKQTKRTTSKPKKKGQFGNAETTQK